MRALLLISMVTLAILPSQADARRKHHHNDDWYERWDNRRDARRAGVIAGVVASGVSRAAQNERIEDRYEECMLYSGYDYECERRRYYEEQRARANARRTGWAVGVVTREIIRD